MLIIKIAEGNYPFDSARALMLPLSGMLTPKIKAHNYINGYMFSAVEFILAAGIIFPFFVYYLWHGRLLLAGISIGLVSNFIVIVSFALASLRRGEESIGLAFYLDAKVRRQVAREYPDLQSDTVILCLALLIPFCLTVAVLYESWEKGSSANLMA